MRPLFASLLLSLLFLLPLRLWGQEDFVRDTLDGYYFELMDVDVTVHADRTYDVVEQIDARFVEPRHGIIRDIPTRFYVNRDVSPQQDGSEYKVLYNGVTIDGIEISEPYSQSEADDVLSLRIGSADAVLQGRHHYRIGYRLSLPNDRVKAGDLFFHSVLGTAWSCSMDSVHFTIRFDKEVPEASLGLLRVYLGEEGSTVDRTYDLVDQSSCHTVEGSVVCLPAHWGLTLDMPLPEGYFPTDDLSAWSTASWVMAGLTLLALLMLVVLEWRGDQGVTPVVTFQPGLGLTSADIGSLIDGRVDDEDLLSMIPWFAAHGYLSIRQEGDSTLLTKLQPLSSSAPEYQQILFNAFFDKGSTFDLSTNSSAFGRAWQQAKASLKAQYKGKLDVMEGKTVLGLATLLLSLTYCFAQVEPDGWVMGGVIHVLLIAAIFVVLSARSVWKDQIHFTGCAATISSLWILTICGGAISFGVMLLLSAHEAMGDSYLPSGVLLGLMVAMLLVIVCVRRLKRMTPYRRERLGEIMGLKEFIQTAEEDRLRMLLSQDERYFYHILPFAMAFGMVDEWAAKFKNLPVAELQEFGHTPVVNISHCINRSRWASCVASSVTSYHAASGGSRSRAGGSRGGYSGGGSGGGGGRSW